MNARGHSLAVRFIALAPVALICAAAGACGVDGDGVPLPVFEGGVEGSTSANDADVEAAADASEDGNVSEASTSDAANDSGDASTSATGLVISQVQTRGTGAPPGNDEFIEIYNASSASITFDSTWTVTVRNAASGCSATSPTLLYTGAGQVIASHKHLLLATSSYSELVTADATFSAGISDAASVVLLQSGLPIDALCFAYDTATTTTLTTCTTPYVCEGTPATNPHDGTGTTDTDASLERKPGGNGGNTVDANDNATDFLSNAAADPHNLASAAVP